MPLSSLRNSFRRKNKPQKLKVTEDSLFENSQDKQAQRKTSPHHIFSKVGDAKALWTNKFEAYAAKQASNPFSDKYVGPAKIDKNDPNYGRPDANSLTAQRARDGEAKLRQEVCDLCDVIFNLGTNTCGGMSKIQFGELFQIYNGINDKVVGLLLRARKKHLLTFEGEMLFQRRDDDKWISLRKSINTIHVYFGRSPDVVDGGDVDYEDPELSNEIKATSNFSNVNSAANKNGDDTENSGVTINGEVSKVESITYNSNENKNEIGKLEDTIDIKECETDIKLIEDIDSNKLKDANHTEQRKSKLSFRFPSRRPSKMASNKESPTSPTELSASSNGQERKKSVMATLFDNLPIIPPQHVSTATVNLKKKTDEKDGSLAKNSSSVVRRISIRLKSRRKSEAPCSISPSNNRSNPCKPNDSESCETGISKSNNEQMYEVMKSKSCDDNVKLVSALGDDIEKDTEKMKALTPDDLREQESNQKTNRKISRRESIAAAAASARLKWQQMKNATPSVHRMSLKKKREKRDQHNLSPDEQNNLENDDLKIEKELIHQVDNNNGILEDSKKESIAKISELS